MKRLKSILMIFVAFLGLAINEAYASSRVVVRQDMDLVRVFSGKNTKYIIKDDINLGGKRVTVGEGSVLVFKGGSLSYGTIIGTYTRVKAPNYEIFKRGYTRYRACIKAGANTSAPPTLLKEYHDCLFVEGTWSNKKCGSNWTGLQNGNDEDIMPALRNYIVLHKAGAKVTVPHIDALGYESTCIPGGHQIDFSNSNISYPDDLNLWEDRGISLPAGAIQNPLESGYGLLSLQSNTTVLNLTIDGKSTFRLNEQIRLGVSCVISIGNAHNVVLENVNISNVLGPGMTAQAGAKDIIFKNCRFYNIGEHIVYSHQYLGYCRFEGCTFDTWDSERISVFRNGTNYLYKHTPLQDRGNATYDELYAFDLSFTHCTFNNPKRINSQGRVLGGFLTGDFPVVVKINDCTFIGAPLKLNPGGRDKISELSGKVYRMIVNDCDGAPYAYPSNSNYNIITEFYRCINIPFRTVYTKRYENCRLFLDIYEDNVENVSSSFKKEFVEPLVIKDCVLIDRGTDVIINHPIMHRPVCFDHCRFESLKERGEKSNIIIVQSNELSFIKFFHCIFNLPGYRLAGGNKVIELLSIQNCLFNAIEEQYCILQPKRKDTKMNKSKTGMVIN